MSRLSDVVEAEGLVHVTGLRAGGYSWSELAVYWKPDAGRFYWLDEGGCSCNYFGDSDDYSLSQFGDGDRDAALRELDGVRHWEGDPSAEEIAQAKTALRDFREVPA